MTEPERMIYAAAFAASLNRNFFCPEPMSHQDAAAFAALDARYAVEALRTADPVGLEGSGMLAAFRGDATST
jgi:hypothetical protein